VVLGFNWPRELCLLLYQRFRLEFCVPGRKCVTNANPHGIEVISMKNRMSLLYINIQGPQKQTNNMVETRLVLNYGFLFHSVKRKTQGGKSWFWLQKRGLLCTFQGDPISRYGCVHSFQLGCDCKKGVRCVHFRGTPFQGVVVYIPFNLYKTKNMLWHQKETDENLDG